MTMDIPDTTTTISLTTDAYIYPPIEGKDSDTKIIHCPDFPNGALVEVVVDGGSPVQCRVVNDDSIVGAILAIPHQMFPDFDSTLTDDLMKEGASVPTHVKLLEKRDPEEQLQIDFYLEGKTHADITS